jgi:hypothetical protein
MKNRNERIESPTFQCSQEGSVNSVLQWEDCNTEGTEHKKENTEKFSELSLAFSELCVAVEGNKWPIS